MARGGTVRVSITADSSQLERAATRSTRELERIGAAGKVAGGGFAAAGKQAAAAGGHINTVSGRLDAHGKKLQSFGHSMSGLSLPIGIAGAASVKFALDFQSAMEQVHTQAGASQKEVDELKKKVLALAPTVGVGPNELAKGLYRLESAGLRGGKAMSALKAAADGARVGHTDLESVSNALSGALRTEVKDVHSAGEAMGILNAIVGQGNLRMGDLTEAMGTGVLPTAKQVGLGLKDVGAALDVMIERPLTLGTTMLRLQRRRATDRLARGRAAGHRIPGRPAR